MAGKQDSLLSGFFYLMISKFSRAGWVKLHRDLLCKPFFKKASHLAIWVYLLLRTRDTPGYFIYKGKRYELQVGEFICSMQEIAKYLELNISVICYILDRFERQGHIKRQIEKKWTIIKIMNWESRQKAEQKVGNENRDDWPHREQRHRARYTPQAENIKSKDLEAIRNTARETANQMLKYLKEQRHADSMKSKHCSYPTNRLFCRLLIERLIRKHPNEDYILNCKRLIDIAIQDNYDKSDNFRYIYLESDRLIDS